MQLDLPKGYVCDIRVSHEHRPCPSCLSVHPRLRPSPVTFIYVLVPEAVPGGLPAGGSLLLKLRAYHSGKRVMCT